MSADAVAWLEAQFEEARRLPHYKQSVLVRCLLDLLPTEVVWTEDVARWPTPFPLHDLEAQLAQLQARFARWSA